MAAQATVTDRVDALGVESMDVQPAGVGRGRSGVPRRRITGAAGQGEYPLVSVIVPTINEARNLPLVLAEIPDGIHEVVIVDGHSTDGTREVARRAYPGARIITQTGRGKGDALRCGFEAASGDILVMMDADGSADPAEIPRFVEALLGGADFAKGSRYCQGGGSADITPLRSAGNTALSATVNVLFGTSYSDLCYGFNAFWRHCLPAIDVDCTGFEVETLINIRVARAPLTVREVPSYERCRIHGESNLRTFRDGGRVLRTIVRERLRAPKRAPADRHRSAYHLDIAFTGEAA